MAADALRRSGRLTAAAALYRKLIARCPTHLAALNGLETTLRALKRPRNVASVVRQQRTATVDTLCCVAQYAADEGLPNIASECYARAVRTDPRDRYAVWGLAQTMRRRGRLKEALRWYRRYQALDPGEPESAHMIAALSGTRVPRRATDAYVTSVFDGFAEEFDNRLLNDLYYRAPEILFENVTHALGETKPTLDVLDLGCGTGLAGVKFRPLARRIEGVDLSREMVRRARKRGVYDRLQVGEMTEALARSPARYDLIVAADVFCYVGELTPVVQGAARALKPGAHLAFTVERRLQAGFAITRSGRYAHSPGYVRRVGRRAGLKEIRGRKVILRYEFGVPVWGHVTVMRKL